MWEARASTTLGGWPGVYAEQQEASVVDRVSRQVQEKAKLWGLLD